VVDSQNLDVLTPNTHLFAQHFFEARVHFLFLDELIAIGLGDAFANRGSETFVDVEHAQRGPLNQLFCTDPDVAAISANLASCSGVKSTSMAQGYAKSCREAMEKHPASAGERIDDTHAGMEKIRAISRDDHETVSRGRGRNEAVLDGHRFPGSPQPRQQFRPF
jgi:hypothetical protein